MNTVDALNVLGKALCGDSFEVKPGLTDAETILEIAKNYTGGSGESSGSSDFEIMLTLAPGGGPLDTITDVTFEEIEAAVTAGKNIVFSGPDPSDNTKRRVYFAAVIDEEATAIRAIFDIYSTDTTTPPTLTVGSILFTKQASASPATVSLSFAEIDINA